jgi:5-deoxy-D-glucuronate isomerase
MKSRYSLVLVIFLAQFSSLAQSECLPVACYVEKIRVLSCRSVSEVVVSGTRLQQLGIRQKQAQAILNNSSTVVVQGKVSRSRYVAQCAEPDTQRFADGTMMREYLVSDASCADYPPNSSAEGFVTTTCCDTLPVDSAECLLTMETMGPQPKALK